MSNDNVVKLIQPGTFDDQLTEILRQGARALLAQAVEAEVADFLAKHADLKTEDGRRRIVRHGHLPEREVMTGIGPVAVRQPRVRDREAAADDPEPHPLHARDPAALRAPLEVDRDAAADPLPEGHLDRRFRRGAGGLARQGRAGAVANAIARLKDGWIDEHDAGRSAICRPKRYVYVWADGIHLQARLEDEKQCILVLIGATPEGRKELVGFTDGARESAQDWRDLLLDLKRRGLDVRPELAIADGALGFWKAPARSGRRPASSAAGCTRPRTCSPSCRRASSRRPSAPCRRSGWPRRRPTPRRRSTPSSRATEPSTTRRRNA